MRPPPLRSRPVTTGFPRSPERPTGSDAPASLPYLPPAMPGAGVKGRPQAEREPERSGGSQRPLRPDGGHGTRSGGTPSRREGSRRPDPFAPRRCVSERRTLAPLARPGFARSAIAKTVPGRSSHPRKDQLSPKTVVAEVTVGSNPTTSAGSDRAFDRESPGQALASRGRRRPIETRSFAAGGGRRGHGLHPHSATPGARPRRARSSLIIIGRTARAVLSRRRSRQL